MTTAGTQIAPQAERVVRVLAALSLLHSAIYVGLLFVWLTPGMHGAEFVFGLSHGLGWIAMSLLCVTAAARRLIPVRTGVGVAILGGIGPFIGTYEFMRLRHEGAYPRSN